MNIEARKWRHTFEITWANHMAYKFNFFLLIIGPTIVFFLIKYNIWVSIFELQGREGIGGYSLQGMIEYQAWVLIVMLIAQSHMSIDIAEDIRYGRISSYLLYPFEFGKYHIASFMSFQSIQFFAGAVALCFLLMSGLLTNLALLPFITGVLFCVLVGILWFEFQFLFGIVAFWLEQTWVLRAMFINVSQFFSGAIIPLELYPEWLRRLLEYSPFPSMTYIPVRILSGEFQGSIGGAFLLVLIWIVVLRFVVQFVWRRGVRLYSAAGM